MNSICDPWFRMCFAANEVKTMVSTPEMRETGAIQKAFVMLVGTAPRLRTA